MDRKRKDNSRIFFSWLLDTFYDAMAKTNSNNSANTFQLQLEQVDIFGQPLDFHVSHHYYSWCSNPGKIQGFLMLSFKEGKS